MTGGRKGKFKSGQVCRRLPAFWKNMRAGAQKGAALITVLLLTLLLLVFAGSLVQLTTVDKRMSASQVAMTQALYLAEAGVEVMVARLAGNFDAGPPSTPIELGNGRISKITVSPVDASTREILAEGRAGNARKALKVRVQRTAAPVLQNALCAGNSPNLSGNVSISGNLLINGNLETGSSISLTNSRLVVVKGNLDNKNGSINILSGGSLLVGGNLYNRHGRIETPGYLQVDGAIDNSSGTVIFSPGGTYYTPATQYPAGTFIIQNDGQVPRLDGPRENIAALVEPAARLDPAEKVDAYQGYPSLPVTRNGNKYEFDFTGKTAGIYYLDTATLNEGDKGKGKQVNNEDKQVNNEDQKIQLSGTYSGKWLIAVKGNVEISGDLQPANANQDVLVLLVDGTVSIQGNENVSAVIYACLFEAGGSSTIRGTVVAQSFDVGGNASLIQDTDLIRNAVPVLPSDLITVNIISWREEYDVF
ncbi:PilX N-terminal domain-containing pilus assembly protein [Desulfofundulus thermosubterraneus]|uniref:PilX N-terminal n=1 Tax=Desulfofundulus thermosubterraneus DSM 16057 TaxID=1121432 RepID=A0A1M6GGS2_9FIRM|nr:PilX N-terminal domain-containing pilus assembly protein [Desulfofundulus thermosubterraneus]SHJ09170.1 PilX N-terminal [Desulfofundulus thermosubterraneus DSM 16057]